MTEQTKVLDTEQAEMNKQAVTDDIEFDSNIAAEFTSKKQSQEYNDERMRCNIVFDTGASQTRSALLFPGKQLSTKDLRVTDSQYAIIGLDEDLTIFKKTSNDIIENGQYIIQEEESSPYLKDSWFQKPQHILKGKLISKLNKAPRSIDNQRDKSEDIGIFVNLLTAIADVGLEYRVTNLSVRLGFLLPPKERYSDSNRVEQIRKTIAGNYTIKMPRYNYEVNVSIIPEDVVMEAEGEAAFIFYTTRGKNAREKHAEYSDKLVTIQDLGSSTFNIGLISDGSIQSGVSHTAKYGGENLISKLYQILSRTRREPISFEQARKAVETGYVQIGANVVPVGQELTKAKQEVAEILAKEYTTFLQIAGKHASAIYANIFVGRGMKETGGYDGEGNYDAFYSPSIAHLLAQEYSKMSESTNPIILKEPGLANLLGIASVMKFSWEL